MGREGWQAVAILVAVVSSSCSRRVEQPVAFNHRLHAYNNVPCLLCHPGAESGQGAGLPAVTVCRRCHEDVLYEAPEKAKIRTAFESGRGLAWVPVFALQRYVYFSHRRHVAIGRIRCDECHGNVEQQTAPFGASVSPFAGRAGMKSCLACHATMHSHYAGVDCVNCHR